MADCLVPQTHLGKAIEGSQNAQIPRECPRHATRPRAQHIGLLATRLFRSRAMANPIAAQVAQQSHRSPTLNVRLMTRLPTTIRAHENSIPNRYATIGRLSVQIAMSDGSAMSRNRILSADSSHKKFGADLTLLANTVVNNFA